MPDMDVSMNGAPAGSDSLSKSRSADQSMEVERPGKDAKKADKGGKENNAPAETKEKEVKEKATRVGSRTGRKKMTDEEKQAKAKARAEKTFLGSRTARERARVEKEAGKTDKRNSSPNNDSSNAVVDETFSSTAAGSSNPPARFEGDTDGSPDASPTRGLMQMEIEDAVLKGASLPEDPEILKDRCLKQQTELDMIVAKMAQLQESMNSRDRVCVEVQQKVDTLKQMLFEHLEKHALHQRQTRMRDIAAAKVRLGDYIRPLTSTIGHTQMVPGRWEGGTEADDIYSSREQAIEDRKIAQQGNRNVNKELNKVDSLAKERLEALEKENLVRQAQGLPPVEVPEETEEEVEEAIQHREAKE